MDKGLNARDDGGLFPRLQQRYGLRADPLEMEAPFYPDAARQHALETLRHLCGFGDLALLLLGAPGMGKTRILSELVRAESARLDFHRIPAAALTSALPLARDLAAISRSPTDQGGSPRETVYAFFRWSEGRTRKGQRMVLLIDDADRAAPEVLRLLLAGFLASDPARAAVPVFAGTDALVSMLGVEEDAAGLHPIHLPALSTQDIAAYLEPRVQRAGGPVGQLLTPRRLAQIYALSGGSFTGIRRAAPAVWLGLAEPRVARVGRGLNVGALLWPGIALTLLAVSWWFVSAQYEHSVSDQQARDAAPAAPVRKSVTIGPGALAEPSPEMPGDAVDGERSDPEPAHLRPAPALVPPVPEREPLAEPEPEPEPAPAPVAAPEPAPEPAPAPVAASGPESPAAVASLAFTPARPEAFVPLASLSQEDGWTIQLVAGRLERTALNMLERGQGDGGALRYTLGERQGEPWFMVLYGRYPSREAAQAAARQLSSRFGVSDPWVRSLASFNEH